MFVTRIYLYDSSQAENGYRGLELSNNILQGCENVEDITQELDTAEITLCGLTKKDPFLPQTKFIVDIWEEINGQKVGETPLQTFHWVVSKDMVEQPILSDDNYFNHHISFIEPSVIAQQRIVDNIAITYKLKDVNLEERPTFDLTKQTTTISQSSEYNPTENFGKVEGGGGFLFSPMYTIHRFGKYFKLNGDFKVIYADDSQHNTYYNDYDDFDDNGTHSIRFKVPKLEIYGGAENTKTFNYIGDASIDCIIREYAEDGTTLLNTTTQSFITNTPLSRNYYIPKNGRVGSLFVLNGQYENLLDEWITEGINYKNTVDFGYVYKKYVDTTQQSTPTYITNPITVVANHKYVVEIAIHSFDDDIYYLAPHSLADSNRAYTYNGDTPTKKVSYEAKDAEAYIITPLYSGSYFIVNYDYSLLTNKEITANTEYFIYDINLKSILYQSAIPYSALDLLSKAIMNSAIYDKKQDIFCGDIQQNDTPFYVDDNYVSILSRTSVIENFYNQKNLWQIMVDVGNYIHAIPELKFGSDDKFMITFNELGRTDQQTKQGEKTNIFNSRGVEDYISSTSSYISNMVQLGGYIEEWVFPKTSDESLLVSNNTAEIIVSKPIIELLSIKVRNNSTLDEADITNYIFEKNVYNLLSLEYNVIPNRGLAMYYELGTNKIVGGQYQLPRAITDIYSDYAFKKIIYSAFNTYPTTGSGETDGYWRNLKIQDYSFMVRYRTKDDVRQTHSRPDLRKYLLNSQYDKYPQHNQFNNQTDTLVDSIAFGNNMFGKLIKTGNNSYEISEWTDDWQQLKHKGELYKINDELYYVAKVTHYVFSSYVISKISYSKDYNELSAIIGIPSEPRFYEVSEQSAIRRDVAINQYLLLSDDPQDFSYDSMIFDATHLKNLCLREGGIFAKYAMTTFKSDKDVAKYSINFGQDDFSKDILSPINAYSSGNTLTYEWDMVDNYSAGDKVVDVDENSDVDFDERAYSSLYAVPYSDAYGKSHLLDFYILSDVTFTDKDQFKALPESPIYSNVVPNFLGLIEQDVASIPTDEQIQTLYTNYVIYNYDRNPIDGDFIFGRFNIYEQGQQTGRVDIPKVFSNGEWISYQSYNSIFNYAAREQIFKSNVFITNVLDPTPDKNERGIVLLKDNRETVSIDCNVQLITSSDTFVVSPFFFLPNKTNMYVVFLNEEVNKLSNGYIPKSAIMSELYDINDNLMSLTQFSLHSSFPNRVKDFMTQDNWEQKDLLGRSVTFPTGFYLNCENFLNQISPKHFNGGEYTQVKAIAIICNVAENPSDGSENPDFAYSTRFVVARNIPSNWTKEQAIKNWYFAAPDKDKVFREKQ